jgi:phage shock protein A
MQPDLNHTEREIKKHQVRIEELRREADVQRQMADQRVADGAMTGPDYYEDQADKLEQQARDMETELTQLQAEKERFEKRISELEAQKAQVANTNAQQLDQIEKELARLRGSSFMA